MCFLFFLAIYSFYSRVVNLHNTLDMLISPLGKLGKTRPRSMIEECSLTQCWNHEKRKEGLFLLEHVLVKEEHDDFHEDKLFAWPSLCAL